MHGSLKQKFSSYALAILGVMIGHAIYVYFNNTQTETAVSIPAASVTPASASASIHDPKLLVSESPPLPASVGFGPKFDPQNTGLNELGKIIGSEGYAPTIRNAFQSGTPVENSRAFFILQKCKDVQKDMESLQQWRANSTDSRKIENYTRLINVNLAEQRACQSIDRETAALRPMLLMKAAQGNEVGMALIFVAENEGSSNFTAAEKKSMVSLMRRDADKGHLGSMMMLAVAGESSYGLTSDEQHIYQSAVQIINKSHPDAFFAPNKGLQDLLGLAFDSESSGQRKDQQKVLDLVEAHLRLRKVDSEVLPKTVNPNSPRVRIVVASIEPFRGRR